jgi:uncharacterized protein (DUF1697 family)
VNTYVALLRAVNLGPHQRLPMARLRALTEAAGGEAVRTHLQSGNVVFTAPQTSAAEVAAALGAALAGDGLATEVMVRTGGAVIELATSGHPDAAAESTPQNLQVAFPLSPVSREAVAGMPIPGHERATWWRGEVALHYPDGVGRSKLTTAHLAKHLGTPVTCRNWRTVRALADLARNT